MSISAKQLVESYKGFKVKAVTKDKHRVILWECKPAYNGDNWVPLKGLYCKIDDFEITEFMGKEAKDCIYIVEESVDETKWIGCLCWFKDCGDTEEKLGILTQIIERGHYKWYERDGTNGLFALCRPAKPDEVQFVEDAR